MPKIAAGDYVGKLGANTPTEGGFWANAWYNHFKIYLSLFGIHLQFRTVGTFLRLMAQTMWILGFRWYCCPFRGSNSPNSTLGAWIGVFKTNAPNIAGWQMWVVGVMDLSCHKFHPTWQEPHLSRPHFILTVTGRSHGELKRFTGQLRWKEVRWGQIRLGEIRLTSIKTKFH